MVWRRELEEGLLDFERTLYGRQRPYAVIGDGGIKPWNRFGLNIASLPFGPKLD